MDTIELADGGLLLYDETFLPPELSDRYFVELRDHTGADYRAENF